MTITTDYHVNVINEVDSFFDLREQWNELNDHSTNGNIFVSWEWLYTWWETYHAQGKRRLYIISCTNKKNELVGIAPFQIINNPKKYFPCNRQLIFLGTGETDGSSIFGEYMDLIIKKGHESTVISSISKYLDKNEFLWDGSKFHQQLAGSHLLELFKSDRHERNDGLANNTKFVQNITSNGFRTLIELPETYKEYLMSLKGKMRNNITRMYSRLEAEQHFTIETVTVESEMKAELSGQDSGIEIIAKLNRVRRNNMGESSVFSFSNFELFHKRVIKRLLPLNKVSLQILRFEEEPVAALYSFIDGDIVHAYQSGFETKQGHRYSLLTTMFTQEISKSIENPEISRFNFMYSNEEGTYKKRYSGTTEEMYDISYDKTGIKSSVYSYIHGPLKTAVKKRLKRI